MVQCSVVACFGVPLLRIMIVNSWNTFFLPRRLGTKWQRLDGLSIWVHNQIGQPNLLFTRPWEVQQGWSLYWSVMHYKYDCLFCLDCFGSVLSHHDFGSKVRRKVRLYSWPCQKLFKIIFTVWYLVRGYNYDTHSSSRLFIGLKFIFDWWKIIFNNILTGLAIQWDSLRPCIECIQK